MIDEEGAGGGRLVGLVGFGGEVGEEEGWWGGRTAQLGWVSEVGGRERAVGPRRERARASEAARVGMWVLRGGVWVSGVVAR